MATYWQNRNRRQKYWEMRKAKQMHNQMKTADKAAREIKKAYDEAEKVIQESAEKIFEKYRTKHGLSREEAERLLKKVRSKTDLKKLKEELKKDPKNAALAADIEAQAYGARIRHLAELERTLTRNMITLGKRENAIMETALTKVAEDSFYHNIFDLQQYSGAGFPISAIDPDKVKQVLNMHWSGKDFSSRIWSNKAKLAEQVKEEIMLNLLTGRDLKGVSEAISGQFGTSYSNAKRLIRTEAAYVSNQLQLEGYRQAGIKQYVYVAVLDMRTSKICQSLDKKVFRVADAAPGKNLPPMHPWCRSTTIAYFSDAALKRMKQRALDPRTGKKVIVPGDMTYAEWKEKFVDSKPIGIESAAFEKAGRSEERNLTKEQYDRYKERLGDSFPHSYDEFIKLKGDKEKWAAYKESYKASGENDKYNDLTAIMRYNIGRNEADVSDADYYIAPDGRRFNIGEPGVILDPAEHERNTGELLSRMSGEKVYMCPRVAGKNEKVSTPDYITAIGEKWEKKRPEGKGSRAIKDMVAKAKEQAPNFIIDISKWKGERSNAIAQAERLLSQHDTAFVKQVIIIDDMVLIEALARK